MTVVIKTVAGKVWGYMLRVLEFGSAEFEAVNYACSYTCGQ